MEARAGETLVWGHSKAVKQALLLRAQIPLAQKTSHAQKT